MLPSKQCRQSKSHMKKAYILLVLVGALWGGSKHAMKNWRTIVIFPSQNKWLLPGSKCYKGQAHIRQESANFGYYLDVSVNELPEIRYVTYEVPFYYFIIICLKHDDLFYLLTCYVPTCWSNFKCSSHKK
jgi:hypothetical protein